MSPADEAHTQQAQTQPASLPPPPPGYGGAPVSPPPGYELSPPQPPAPSAAPGELLVELECPHCGRLSRVIASFVGQSGNCPGCLALLEVTHPDAPAEPASQPLSQGLELVAPAPRTQVGLPVEVARASDPDPLPAGAGHRPRHVRWVAPEALAQGDGAGFASRTKPCLICGEQIRVLARRCDFCGEFQSEGERRAQRQTGGGSVLPVASVGKRLTAAGINLALFAVPAALVVPLVIVLDNAGRAGSVSPALAGIAAVAWLGGLLLYFGVQWVLIAQSGQNLGKRWVGIKIVKMDGSDVGFVDGVVLREWIPLGLLVLCSSLYALLTLASTIMLLTPQRRTLHDLLAGTVVIDAKA